MLWREPCATQAFLPNVTDFHQEMAGWDYSVNYPSKGRVGLPSEVRVWYGSITQVMVG